ncbi:hypothetical protein OG455_29030 [Kitasatospora sp. NBC_01287]|uniref:hypothetical protein n=1 Tax=Kitasatospora sp. NBC_01287 TaxID=2903573 RepID=UPI0022572432|nr:hypothetical protein [Kitasatospora sp. NBC_01287]MCX4749507.1 hypothetical protein [Kitasatospora sp. NBC_01287]
MRTTIGTAIRLAESVLLAGGRRQARLNAWSAVCENRRHAADREAARASLSAAGGR